MLSPGKDSEARDSINSMPRMRAIGHPDIVGSPLTRKVDKKALKGSNIGSPRSPRRGKGGRASRNKARSPNMRMPSTNADLNYDFKK